MTFVPTEEQAAVLKSPAKLRVCYGGPGSGKTSVGLAACLQDLDSGFRPLVLTFSRGAAQQLLSKLRESSISPRGIDILTYHAFALKILQSWGRYAGLPRKYRIITMDQAKRLTAAGVDRHPHLLATGELTFADVLATTMVVLQTWPKLIELYAKCYDLIVLDEFQDTSNDQWALVDLIFPDHRKLFMGDPNQSIYKWSGANPNRLLQLIQNPPPETDVFELTGSQRFTEPIQTCAGSFLQAKPPKLESHPSIAVKRFRNWKSDGGSTLKLMVEEMLKSGAASVAIFGRRKQDVERISEQLSTATSETDFAIPHRVIDPLQPEKVDRLTDILIAESDLSEGTADHQYVARVWGDAFGSLGAGALAGLLIGYGTSPQPNVFIQRLGKRERSDLESWEHRWQGLPAFARERPDVPSVAAALQKGGVKVDSFKEELALAAGEAASIFMRSPKGRSRDSLVAVRARRAERDVGAAAPGVYVMTMHRGKGREFDGAVMVVIGDEFMFNQSKYFEEERQVLHVTASRPRTFLGFLLPAPVCSALFRHLILPDKQLTNSNP